jgi:hypothetical protein
MRERIRARLKQYRAEAVDSIGAAVNRTKSTFSGVGRTNGGAYYLAINKDNEVGLANYMDRSAAFIRQIAPGSSAEYVDELWDGGDKLKQEIMAKQPDSAFKVQLDETLDKLIKRKVEDFEVGLAEGKDRASH